MGSFYGRYLEKLQAEEIIINEPVEKISESELWKNQYFNCRCKY